MRSKRPESEEARTATTREAKRGSPRRGPRFAVAVKQAEGDEQGLEPVTQAIIVSRDDEIFHRRACHAGEQQNRDDRDDLGRQPGQRPAAGLDAANRCCDSPCAVELGAHRFPLG